MTVRVSEEDLSSLPVLVFASVTWIRYPVTLPLGVVGGCQETRMERDEIATATKL